MPPRTRNLKANVATTSKNKEKAPAETSKRAGKRPQIETTTSKRKSNARANEPAPPTAPEECPEVSLTDAEEDDLQCLRNITLHPTRFLRVSVLKSMRLYNDVIRILENMGLEQFVQFRQCIYPELTREFFATVELTYENPRRPHPDEGYLTFKVNRTVYRVTIREVCRAYGFAYNRQVKFQTFHNADEFWDLIATGSSKGCPKMRLIRNPALRIVAKFLANTFFARKDTASVKLSEMCMLFRGVRDLLTDRRGYYLTDYLGNEVNFGCVFAKELANIRVWARKTTEPHCYMGGMLGPLLDFVGVPLASHYQEETTDSIDRQYLVRCGILEDTEDVYKYIFFDREKRKCHFILPCPDKTTVTVSDNIKFEHEAEPSGTPSPPPQALPLTFDDDTWELPELRMKPRTAREKIFHGAYKMQQKINKIVKRKFKWIKSKLRTLPGYVSDEEEFLNREREEEENRVSDDDDEGAADASGESEDDDNEEEDAADDNDNVPHQGDSSP